MSGNLKSFEELKQLLNDKLDKYITMYGLDSIKHNSEVDLVLSMNFDQLKNLDKQGCDEYAYLLAQHSLVLVKETNRQRAIQSWANSELDKIIAQQANNYGSTNDNKYIKYELLKNKIIQGDGGANVLNDILISCDIKINQLNDISPKLEFMSKILSNLSRSK